MSAKASDFPFTIMDVIAILHLNIRRKSPDYVYTDCPLCGSRRGKLCANLVKNTWYSNCCGESGGMLALYAKTCHVSNSGAYREICDALLNGYSAREGRAERKESVKEPASAMQSDRADPQAIHSTFAALLSELTLTQEHREHLRNKRGLSDVQIESFGFKSTPPQRLCPDLTAKLIQAGHTVQGVPGFYKNKIGRWTVNFHSFKAGILIPYRSVDGLIRGLQIRLDRPIKSADDPPDKKGAKYLWLASSGKPYGVSSGSPIHFAGDPSSRVVYVTEGALKADIAHALMNRTFAAAGGAGCTSQMDELFDFLKRNGTEEIIEAMDMDKYSNKGVFRGTSKLYLLAQEHGLRYRRLTWNPNYKGVDDWQLALKRKKEQRTESEDMNFKQQYLRGLCSLEYADTCLRYWRQTSSGDIDAQGFLGLTQTEYQVLVRNGGKADGQFRQLLDCQRFTQQFRVYQLNLSEERTIPFAFGGIEAMYNAGYKQPPAAEYSLVYEGKMFCPREQQADEILERIFARYNDDLPADYHGRSISPSDVIELYDSEKRTYFYCNTAGFVPVQFSPLLVRQGCLAANGRKDADARG